MAVKTRSEVAAVDLSAGLSVGDVATPSHSTVPDQPSAGPHETRPGRAQQGVTRKAGLAAQGRKYGLLASGVALLLAVWWFGGVMLRANPDTESFAGFAPEEALTSLVTIAGNGELVRAAVPSLQRIGWGLLWATLIGAPLGVLVGVFSWLTQLTRIPFQLLRMVSPLSWMPIAVIALPDWDSAIIFLLAAAAMWPIVLSTASGVRKIEPDWLLVARNLGASQLGMIRRVIMPAVAHDFLTGLRLALGVAWIVLVPAEYLGVTSGLGYSINDARDTIEYDKLAAYVLVIGILGLALDAICAALLRHSTWQESARGDAD